MTARFAASWRAGVVRYDVDFAARTVAYYGCNAEEYVEGYPAVDLGNHKNSISDFGFYFTLGHGARLDEAERHLGILAF